MAIPSRQIGWGTEENLLWQISKQLEYLTRVVYNINGNTTTSTTSTTTTISGLFSATVDVHEGPFCVSSPLTSFLVTGDGTTFCNSTQFTATEFASLPSGTLALRYGPTDILQVTTDGSNVAVVSFACYTCG